MAQEQYFTGNERATGVSTSGDVTRVTYHGTDVVIIDRKRNTVTFDSGGWETATTRRRMNQAIGTYDLPFQAYIKDYGLYVEDRRPSGRRYGDFPLTFILDREGIAYHGGRYALTEQID